MTQGELTKPPHYTAYLVRLWQESAHAPWRASAQSASSGEKIMFADVEDLFTFLREQTMFAQPNEETKRPERSGDKEQSGE